MKFSTFQKQIEGAGLEARDCGKGHWQVIGGALLVNYYPNAKKGPTLYIAGTNSGKKVWHIEQVIKAAKNPPEGLSPSKRKMNHRPDKKKLYKKTQVCHWCGRHLVLDRCNENPDAGIYFATLDHVIPRSIGGLNNANNYVLACEDCNERRGSDMPEITKGGAA
jgi:hypothetical protein